MNKHAEILRRCRNAPAGLISHILAAADEIERLDAALSKINNATCIHHTDSERANMKCPICLDVEIERLEAENARLEKEYPGLLGLLADIRAAVGDKNGKLMQGELVEHCRKLYEQKQQLQSLRIGIGETGTSYGAGPIGIDWVIVGGESGHGSRPCNVEWVRSIVRQCAAAGVPCFVKQIGTNPIGLTCGEEANITHPKGGDMSEWPADLRVRQMPGGAQ